MIRLREYETICIVNPETSDDTVEQVKGRIVAILDRMEARILRLDNWGKRKLAYEVDKHGKGIYLYALYLGSPGVVEELERNLKMWDDILRFQTIKIDQDVNPDARPAEITDDELKAVEEAALNADEDLDGSEDDQDSSEGDDQINDGDDDEDQD